jgi:hypothetical protein
MEIKQQAALAQLNAALKAASESGLFDTLANDHHPDTISAFCDAVAMEAVIQKGALVFKTGQSLNLAQGQPVVCNGFMGIVKVVHTGQLKGMVDVGLDAGTVCVAANYPNCIPLSVADGQDDAQSIALEIQDLIARLRQSTIEPVSIQYSNEVDFEVRPASDDDRIIVGRKDWGDTVVNYTTEGLILDVCTDTGDVLLTHNVYREDLETMTSQGG